MVLLVAITAVVTFFIALHLASNLDQTSDTAQGFVVGRAIANGNLLLSGWHFPVDNFYFTDSIPYAMAEAMAGSCPCLMAVVPALVYAALVVLALGLCIRPAQPLGETTEALAVIVLLLGVPASIGIWNPMLMSDIHMATIVAALAAFALLSRVATAQTHNLSVAALAFLLAVLTIASDPFSIVFAFAPATVVLAIEAARIPHLPKVRFVLPVLVVAIALGLLLPAIVSRFGGFTTENNLTFRLASSGQWWTNSIAAVFGIVTLWGANPLDVQSASDGLTLAIRCAAVAFALFGLVCLARGGKVALLDRLLCAGAAVSLAACIPSGQFAKGVNAETMWHGGPPMRFLVPAVLFVAVVTCRQSRGGFGLPANSGSRLVTRAAAVAFAALAVLTGTVRSFSAPPPRLHQNPAISAARWLERHRLSQGAGEYWSANLLTAMSGNAVRVRSMVPDHGRLVPYVWVEARDSYARPPQFAVWQEPNESGVTEALVRATWPACALETVAGYRIAILQTSKVTGCHLP